MHTNTPIKNTHYGRINENPLFHGNTNICNSYFAQGHIECTNDGFHRVVLQGQRREKIFVSNKYLQGAMHGDLVRIWVHKKQKRKIIKVVNILKRAHTLIVGQIYSEAGTLHVKPYNNRMIYPVKIMNNRSVLRNGEYIQARIKKYPTRSDGTILAMPAKHLGMSGAKDVARNVIIHEYNLPCKFSHAVFKELEGLPENIPLTEIQKRKDLRHDNVITVDGDTAKDFDDAVSVKRLSGGYLLDVHIADVSYYVKPDTELDKEARRRATSVYFADNTVIPMLPPKLSENLCSLVPHEDRLTFTCRMTFDNRGNLRNVGLFESVINSRARMTYEEVLKILEGNENVIRHAGKWLYRDLHIMADLARILRSKRMKEGSLDINLPKSKPVFDRSGRVVGIKLEKHLFSHHIIEEFMLAANVAITKFLKGVPALYRVHEEPDQRQVDLVKGFLSHKGYYLNNPSGNLSKYFSEAIQYAEDCGEGENMRLLVLHEAIKRSKYSAQNIRHFGLNFDAYTHFTSPIRRYADIVVHRLLKRYINGENNSDTHLIYTATDLESVAQICNKQSEIADKAENEFANWKKLELLKSSVGKTMVAKITKIYESMFFVTLEEYGISSPVFISGREDDKYLLERGKYRIIGKLSGKILTIGNNITVRIESIDWKLKRPVLRMVA